MPQRPLGPPEDPDRFDDFEACVAALSDDPDLSEAEAERICGAWETDTDNASMTDTDDPTHRAYHHPDPDAVALRDVEETAEGTMTVRMPVATTGEVRNAGDDPLTRDELDGMARQINERSIPVFPDHGDSAISPTPYSVAEKLGEWRNADVQTREGGATELVADAVLMDPDDMAADAPSQGLLRAIKEQARRDFALASSIGWREDDDAPGGNDLMEASIVGIPADPRTTSQDAPVADMARAAVDAGADPEAFVATVRAAVMGTDSRAEYAVGDETVDITPPDAVVNAAEAALDAVDRGLGEDCGTGVGSDRARQIIDDEVGPDVVDEVAAYLTSHEEDVTADGPPTDWSDGEWADCGNLQYAKWGGTGTGTGLAWAQDRANAVAEARDEEQPYPDRATHNLDDPEFSVDDAVMWDFQDGTVHGRVAEIGESFTVAGNEITGEDGEAVYLIHEFDEDVEAFRRENVAKPESSLDESGRDLPPASDDNFAGDNTMTDTTDDSTADEQTDADADREERDALGQVAGLLAAVAEEDTSADDVRELFSAAVTQAMDGDDDDEMDDDDEEQAADADPDDTDPDRDADDLREAVAALREDLADVREGGVSADDVETPTPEDGDDHGASDADSESDTDEATATTGGAWL